MNQTFKTVLVAVICLLVGAGGFYAWSTMNELKEENEQLSNQLTETPTTVDTEMMSPTTTVNTMGDVKMVAAGSIAGSLGFPSQGIPPLAIYAFNAGDMKSYTSMLTTQNQMTFTMEDLEPGTYYVVAYTTDGGLSGGYTKAVPCGLSVECTDHSLIPVAVSAGKTTAGIEIKDWYAPEGTFPNKP